MNARVLWFFLVFASCTACRHTQQTAAAQRSRPDTYGLSGPWTWEAKFEGMEYEFYLPEAACLCKTKWDPEKGPPPLTPRLAEEIAIKQATKLRPDVPGWDRDSFELIQGCSDGSWFYVVHLLRGDFFMGRPEFLSIPVLMSGMAVPVISTNKALSAHSL